MPTKMLVAMVTLGVLLIWPDVGDAQSHKAKARGVTSTQQQYVKRHAKVRRAAAATPCVVRTWIGCHGWDPDPHVRMMMLMDAGRDDQ